MMIPPDDPRFTPITARKQLIADGYTDHGIAAALRDHALERPRRGSYVAGTVWAAADEGVRHAIIARAAYQQARTRAVLTHVSALPFLDATMWGLDLSEVHLTREDGKAGRREAGVRQHCAKFTDGDVVTTHGIRHSSASRACLEVITVATVEVALAVVDFFLHRGDTTVAQLKKRYAAGIEHWPNTLTAGLVLSLADPRIESVAEARTSYLLWKQRLPTPVPQHEVRDRDGRLVARLDFAWPELGVWLEFDGKEKYLKHLRPGETVTDAVLREKRRESDIARLTGWRCLRITWQDLEHPERVAAMLRQLFADVAAERRAGA